MARQVVYEGPDLQQLLQQVIDEHGPARIHPPERRRKGGVLGFFAREVYVITVDVDAPAGPAPHGPSVTANGGGLPDAAMLRPAITEVGARTVQPAHAASARGDAGTASGASGASGAPAPASSGASAGAGGAGGAPFQSPLSALVEATEDEAELGAVNGAGGGTRPVEARPSGDPDRAFSAAGNTAAAIPAPAPPRPAPHHAAPAEMDKPFGQVLSEVASSLGEEPGTYRPDPERLRRPRRAQSEGEVPFELGPPAAQAPAAVPHEAAERDARSEPPPEHGADPAPPPNLELDDTTPTIAVQLPLIQMEEDQPPELAATIVDLLRAAGFPEHLLPRAPLAPELSTVEAVFGSLPEPPPLPTEPGGLVAVVGSAGLVRPVAGAVALAVGCPRDEVAVASSTASDRHARPEYRARTATQAASMSPGWRRDRVGVVAVYAPPLGADQRWTRQVLRALRPSCVWGMAGATTKPDDVRRWITTIGGVNALVLTDVAATATPAAILSLGIPVARLDEEPATPARWAAIVADLVTKH